MFFLVYLNDGARHFTSRQRISQTWEFTKMQCDASLYYRHEITVILVNLNEKYLEIPTLEKLVLARASWGEICVVID